MPTGVSACLFWASFVAWLVYVGRLLVAERASDQDAGTSRLLLVCTWGALALGFVAASQLDGQRLPAGALAVGLLLVWLGLALSEWARRELGRHYHPVVAIDEAHAVITSGPYRVIRHPIYAGRLLCLVGFGLAMQNGLSVGACFVLPLAGFAARIIVEERALRDATGDDYARYMTTTRRLVPGVW